MQFIWPKEKILAKQYNTMNSSDVWV